MNKEELLECLKNLSATNNKRDGIDIKKEEAQLIIEIINKQKEVLNRLKVVYTSMQFSAPENMYTFIEQMGDLLEEIE